MANIRHKIFLIIAKWIPVVIAAGILFNNTLAVLEIENIFTDLLDIICGNSISFIITMFACSYAFKFCLWHKIVIIYDLLVLLLNIVIKYANATYYDYVLLLIYHYILAAIFIFIIYHVQKYTKYNE